MATDGRLTPPIQKRRSTPQCDIGRYTDVCMTQHDRRCTKDGIMIAPLVARSTTLVHLCRVHYLVLKGMHVVLPRVRD